MIVFPLLQTFKGGGAHSVSRFDRFLEEELGRSSLRAETRPVLVESIQVLPYDIPVRNLIVVEGRLVVLSDHEVKSIPLHRCNTPSGHSQTDQPPQTCNECVALQVGKIHLRVRGLEFPLPPLIYTSLEKLCEFFGFF